MQIIGVLLIVVAVALILWTSLKNKKSHWKVLSVSTLIIFLGLCLILSRQIQEIGIGNAMIKLKKKAEGEVKSITKLKAEVEKHANLIASLSKESETVLFRF